MNHFKSHTKTIRSTGDQLIYLNDTNLIVNVYQFKINVKNDCNIIIKTYDIDFDVLNDEYELELKAGDTVIDESGYYLKNNDRFEINVTSHPVTISYKLAK